MVDFSVQFNIFAYGGLALIFVIMFVGSVSALFIMHKRRFGALSIIHYIFSWLALILSLALTLLVVDYRLQLIPIDQAPFGIPIVTEFLTLLFTTLMTEITTYATLVVAIASVVIIPFGWGARADFMLPVMPADGDGYIEITDRSQIQCAPLATQVVETQTTEEPIQSDIEDESEWIAHNEQIEEITEETPDTHEVDFDEPVEQPTAEALVDEQNEEIERRELEEAEDGCERRLAEEVIEPLEPTTDTAEEPIAEPKAETIEEPIVEPKAETIEEPTAEPKAETIEDPTAEPKAETIEEPIVEPKAETTEEPIAEPKAETIEEPIAQTNAVEQPVETETEQEKEESAPTQPTVIVVNEKGEVLNPSGVPVIIIKEQATATPAPQPVVEEKKRVRVKSRASEMFKAYLKEKTSEEKHRLEDSIDHVIKNKKN